MNVLADGTAAPVTCGTLDKSNWGTIAMKTRRETFVRVEALEARRLGRTPTSTGDTFQLVRNGQNGSIDLVVS